MQLADAGHPTQFVIDVARGVVAECRGIGVLAAFLVAQGIYQQETGAGLLHLDALGQYGLRHARLGLLQAVLHVHLGQLRIGTRLEGDHNFGDAVGVVGGLEIQQPLGTIERLLDHAGHGIHQHLGRSARIGGCDSDLRRCHVGVLRHRQ
ncbi:hypothetical protein FQZ97_566260 [compost metagenome]